MDQSLCWDLTPLYEGFSAPECKRDMQELRKTISELNAWCGAGDPVDAAEFYIERYNNVLTLQNRLEAYANLRYWVDTKNAQATGMAEAVQKETAELAGVKVRFARWLAAQCDLATLCAQSELLAEHRFFLQEMIDQAEHLLSEEEELLHAKLKLTGSAAWNQLQAQLTSGLQIEWQEGDTATQKGLAEIRNLAFSPTAAIRKDAYEAELTASETVKDGVAACLNGVKGEVITMTALRGFESPLARTIKESRLQETTLQAMLNAIREYLPCFQEFYRCKATLLGHDGGLPFYDLFAAVGTAGKTYSYEEAQAFIVQSFDGFSRSLGNLAREAFEQRWIDVMPRAGKQGGAACEPIHGIRQSRIFCNFAGSFNHLRTLAHELGHAYHSACLYDQSYINSVYTMPIAETASNFCETVVHAAALAASTEEEAFSLLASDIGDAGQVVVDIYSRFLFESELFRRRPDGPLAAEELCEMMLAAQREAFGDGLDHQRLHPYMWLNKVHYYFAEQNFYNFPYAFGMLFAKGLYRLHQERGAAFAGQYEQLLAASGKNSLEDVAALAGIDIRTEVFWRGSLELVAADIRKFIAMAEKRVGK